MIQSILPILLIPAIWLVVAIVLFRKKRTGGFVAACLCTVFLTYMYVCAGVNRRFVPPSDVRTVRQFVDVRGDQYDGFSTAVDSRRHYLLSPSWGLPQHLASALALRSGPPAYVFDAEGILVDWSTDRDDDSRFQRKWWDNVAWTNVGLAVVLQRADSDQRGQNPLIDGSVGSLEDESPIIPPSTALAVTHVTRVIP